MSEVRFPKRNADGSFCVDVMVAVETTEPEKLSRSVESWCRQWANENQTWKRDWIPSGQEILNYADEFKREPYPVGCTSTELTIRLEGQPSAKWWRDWLVLRILADLKYSFVEFRDLNRIQDCDALFSTGDR